jgi:hypothetical protein
VEYRKSGLSLNHIQGCPLDCAYCIRHTYGMWDQRAPRAMLPDAEAVEQLVTHRHFQAHVTPLQILNRVTDPFLPNAAARLTETLTAWGCWDDGWSVPTSPSRRTRTLFAAQRRSRARANVTPKGQAGRVPAKRGPRPGRQNRRSRMLLRLIP